MRTDRHKRSWAAFALIALLGATGCPGKLHDKERFLVDAAAPGAGGASGGGGADGTNPCGDVVTRLFLPKCGSSGCHGAIAPQQGLDLISDGVAARVVGIIGKECPIVLADPADPANSLLYTKLATKPPCGAQMPLAQLPLNAEDSACILQWIADQ